MPSSRGGIWGGGGGDVKRKKRGREANVWHGSDIHTVSGGSAFKFTGPQCSNRLSQGDVWHSMFLMIHLDAI